MKGMAPIHTDTKTNWARVLPNCYWAVHKALNDKSRPNYNEMILSLKYCKLRRQNDDTAEEGMGKVRMKAVECKFQETDRRLTNIS